MKYTHLFHILFCMISMFFITACENADLQKTPLTDEVQITTRADDCEDCPIMDCCCSIEMTAGDNINLVFCGTTGPFLSSEECEFDITGCNDIIGYYQYHTITAMDPKFFFCVSPNTGFSIGTISGMASFKVTCEEGQFNPTYQNFNLSGPQRLYFNVGGDCIVGPCP